MRNSLFWAASGLLLTATASAKTLTVYTYDSFVSEWGPGPAIEQAFEKQCGCDLNLVGLEDGVSILNRLKLEGRYGKADVILGIDNNLIEEARATGLIAPHNIDTSAITLPNGWQEPDFIPYDFGYFAFVYNTERLPEPPTSLAGLVESPSDLKIIYQDPRTSTPGMGLMLWVNKVFGDKAPQAWQQLAAKTVTVTKGWSEAYGMFLEGEADMVLSYTTSPAYHILAENDDRFRAAQFSEGHYMQVEVAAQLTHAAEPELANQFMQFILSPDFQQVIPTTNWMYPVTDIDDLPAPFADSKPAQSLSFSTQEVAKQRRDWINQWLEAVSR